MYKFFFLWWPSNWMAQSWLNLGSLLDCIAFSHDFVFFLLPFFQQIDFLLYFLFIFEKNPSYFKCSAGCICRVYHIFCPGIARFIFSLLHFFHVCCCCCWEYSTYCTVTKRDFIDHFIGSQKMAGILWKHSMIFSF